MKAEEEGDIARQERRRVFRLRLPVGATLLAVIGGVKFTVLEVSELSLLLAAESVPNHEGICRGVIYWTPDERSEFSGTVGATVNNRVIIHDVEGITMSHMVRQQRRVINRYPAIRQLKKSS